MATREITDEQAGEIVEHLGYVEAILQWSTTSEDAEVQGIQRVQEIRRLLGFPA
jgi:hypothetical protein